jgi:chemotaxis protein CheX
MDVKIINAFLDGTVSVLKTMAFVEPKAGAPYVKNDDAAHGDISGVIGLAGSFRGSLALSFSTPCILEIVSNMLGEQITEMNADIIDAVGEITNMVSGAARKNMETDRITVNSSLPTVIFGKEHNITHVMGGPSIIIPFETAKGSFVVDICIGVPNN